MTSPVPTARGEDHAHVQGGHGDADHGAEAAQDGAGVVGEDLEVPGVPAAAGGPRGRETETLVHARVDGALQEGEAVPEEKHHKLRRTQRKQLWFCTGNLARNLGHYFKSAEAFMFSFVIS